MDHRADIQPVTRAPLILRIAAVSVGAAMLAVFCFILCSAVQALVFDGGLALLDSVWQPDAGRFGILPMIFATLALSLTALALGWPMALGCACFVNGIGPAWLARPLLGIIRFMTAIPTVVYGFASLFLLTPFVRSAMGGSGLCWLTAALILSLQILPSMTLTIDSAFSACVRQTALTAAALGLSAQQNLAHIVLPTSRQTLISAALLGFGRAAGDTLLPTMLAGNAVQYATSPLQGLRTLTAHIGLVASSDVSGRAYNSLFLAGGLLLLISASVSLVSRALFRARTDAQNQRSQNALSGGERYGR